jgi:hypothetical protein
MVVSPNRGTGSNALSAVTAVSASNVWAVGSGGSQPLIEHWNGASWSIVPSPSVTGGGSLSGIDAISATNVWAVGSKLGGPLIERWNGTKWTVRNIGPAGKQLTGISATSSTNVWVSAWSTDADDNSYAYLMRWNGSSWRTVWSDSVPLEAAVEIGSLIALSASNVWFVSTSHYPDGAFGSSYHWNGTRVVQGGGPSIQAEEGSHLNGVGASSASNVWEVGQWWGSVGTNGQDWAIGASAAYFNSAAWKTELPRYYTDGSQHELVAVAPVSASNVWAVGKRTQVGSQAQYNLFQHWNGSTWSEYGGPNPAGYNQISAVTAVPGAPKLWAVGTTYGTDGNGPARSMILRCCG